MANTTNTQEFILKASSPAGVGIVATMTTFLAERGCFINEMSQYDDELSERFFTRCCFHTTTEAYTLEDLSTEFAAVAEKFAMSWQLVPASAPTKTLIMVSKFDHCLVDLLYRLHKGEINMEVTAIVSNHDDLRPLAEREGIRFIHLPVTKETKAEQEQAVLDIVQETGTELVVLARYMQILSDNLCQQLNGRAINIHHSFLPGFKGAKPYHQAFERGVKLIGATAHYVTSDLDEGPIIEQAVQPVDHTFSPDELVAIGRDTETIALARAVKMHVEHRVFLNHSKTVVFK